MHELLSAYTFAGGDKWDLARKFGLPVNDVMAWLRGDEIPEKLLSRLEHEAHDQVQRRYTDLLEKAPVSENNLADPEWIKTLLGLDKAFWILYGISVFEFRLRVALRLLREAPYDEY